MPAPVILDAFDGLLRRPDRPLRLAALGVAVFALIAALLAWSSYAGQVANALHDVQLRARGAAADVDRFIQNDWRTLQAVAAVPAVRDGDVPAIQAYLGPLDPSALGLDAGLSFLDAKGVLQVRAGSPTSQHVDYSARPNIQQVIRTRLPVVSDAFVGSFNAGPVIAFDVPVMSLDGRFVGIVAAGLKLDDATFGADNLRYAGGTSAVIVDRSGAILAGPQPVTKVASVAPAFPLATVRVSSEGSAQGIVGAYGDADQLVGWATAPSAGWTVLVETPVAAALGTARAALAIQLGIILAGAALGIALLLWAARRLRASTESERRTLRELQTAVATLERRQALSDAFVGVMSHELRTPVTTIFGGVKVLTAPNGRAHLDDILPDIAEEAERLQRITEDLLVLSRAEHGAVEIHPEPVLVQRLLPMAVADTVRRFPGVRVVPELPADLPAAAGDEGALRQVLTNLLTNAAKYGEGAPIRVAAGMSEGCLRVEVEDAGPGIDPAEHERLFELFYRSPANRRRASGTGIGLFVVRELVEAMGGRVHAEPVEPHGIRFVVRLPIVGADGAVDVDSLATVRQGLDGSAGDGAGDGASEGASESAERRPKGRPGRVAVVGKPGRS